MNKKTQNQTIVTVGKQKFLPSTLSEFLKIYNPNKVKRDLTRIKTVEQALLAKTPIIGELAKRYGIEKIEAYIKIWIIELNEIINAKRHLTEVQIDEIAYQIVSNYRNISIADINIIFGKAKRGEYGALYETLSIDKILSWFADYFEQRQNKAGEISRRKHDNIKYVSEREDKRGTKKEFKEVMREAIHKYNLQKITKKHNNNEKNG